MGEAAGIHHQRLRQRRTGAGCDRLIWARIARCVVYSPLGARAAS